MEKLRQTVSKTIIGTLIIFSILMAMPGVFAQVMSSSNYLIERDSLNFGGGLGSSNNYSLEDTLGEIATGDSESLNYKLRAGYQQMDSSTISFSTTASDVTMTPALGGVTGGTSNGTTTVVVYTNNSSGYTMTINASSSPAMQGISEGGTISDYTPGVSGIPDFTYSVPSGAEFAYTVSASTTSDLAQKFLDNGSVCDTGSSDTSGSASCWYGLSTTATSTIVRSTPTSLSGSTSSLAFKLTVNPGTIVVEDTYNATTTLTAVTL